jgi:ABC-type Mn2+/Zn2+ transport system ATPase subunit
MLISELGIRGFKSYGNNEQVLKLNTEKGELILLVGNNGAGKSVVDSTEITIDISLENLTLEEFKILLEVMGEENQYIEYIKESNFQLYEQYINQSESVERLSS